MRRMTYAAFQELRATLLRTRPGLRDCAETNLYRALGRFAVPADPATTTKVHRCHLASAWTELFGLPPEWSRRALVSSGVRDSLAKLFRHYAGQDARIWIPADNYPVFGDLARGAGVDPETFATLGRLDLPQAGPAERPEILLLTHPLKPAGRWLGSGETAELRRWLAADRRRRLLLDTVYTFGSRFHPATLEMAGTGQTLLLHSLTKGWLVPQLFGIALVPEADFAALAPVFRENPPTPANLSHAWELLTRHPGLPEIVAGGLREAESELRATLPVFLPAAEGAPVRYLFPIRQPWEEFLSREGILGLPGSTFGAESDEWTLLSSLRCTR